MVTERQPEQTDYWMEFQISFVNKGKDYSRYCSGFNVTGLDIDGNGSNAHEYLSFYQLNSYTARESQPVAGYKSLRRPDWRLAGNPYSWKKDLTDLCTKL